MSNDHGNKWRKNPALFRTRRSIVSGTPSTTGRRGPQTTTRSSLLSTSRGRDVHLLVTRLEGRDDPVGGLVWQNSSANAPLPLAHDATCGQLRFDSVKRNLYYACAEGDHIRLTSATSQPGQRTGIEYRNVNVPASPGRGDVGHLFPALSVDRAGNV